MATLGEMWTEDCRNMIPDFELYSHERMTAEVARAKKEMGMPPDAEDIEVVVEVLRDMDEDKGTVPGPWWWIYCSLLILEDIETHPWFECGWWAFYESRGKRELNTIWGSANSGKTEFFAALILTNMVVWLNDAHAYVSSPFQNAGQDKIWKAVAGRRVGMWAGDGKGDKDMRPKWAKTLGLSFVHNKSSLEISVRDRKGNAASCSFVSLETAAQVQGKKNNARVTHGPVSPRRGIMLLVGDELILNPAACSMYLEGEQNVMSQKNYMGWVGMNPRPEQVKHPSALPFSHPIDRSTDQLNETVDFTWRTQMGRLYRFARQNGPNRFQRRAIFDYLINDDQIEASMRRGEDGVKAMTDAWGWGTGSGNGGVLSQEAIDSTLHQSPPAAWHQAPVRSMFVDLAFGGSDPAGYCCFEHGVSLQDGKPVAVISAIEQDKIHVERKWTPTYPEFEEFRRLTERYGGQMPEDLAAGTESSANTSVVFGALRAAARLGVPRGHVAFDSSMRPDVTEMMRRVFGHVPYYYSGTRPLREEQINWPMFPPSVKPDGTMETWADKHSEVISAVWRFAEHLIARGHVFNLVKVRKGTTELIGRPWEQRSAVKTDVLGKKKLGKSPMWGETLALGLVFAVRFCGALPQLKNEKPWVEGAASSKSFFENPLFRIQRNRPSARMWRVSA